jgi:hypothetical protein
MAQEPNRNRSNLRLAVATALEGLSRRLKPAEHAVSRDVPGHLTQAAAQQANAQSLYQQSVQSNQAKTSTLPGSMTADPLQDLMLKNQAPQDSAVSMYAPGAPLVPAAGIEPPEGARQFEYQPGYNVASLPRSTESTAFAQLRMIALLTDAVQIAEQVYFDIFTRLKLVVGFEEGTIPDGESEQDKKWRAISKPAEDWLQFPDGQRPVGNWTYAAWRDVAELGYSTIFLRRNRIGDIISLDLVDSATMKPLIDGRGRQPLPPFPAWQQFLWGVPAGRYTNEQIYSLAEGDRTESIYPISRIERILLSLNMLLRKQNLDMTRFTDGSIPEGVIAPPADGETEWDADHMEEYERLVNGLIAGNDRRKVRLKVIPPGAKIILTRPPDPQMDLNKFLITIVAADFGLTLEEMAFTETSNKSTGQTQQNVTYRRAVEPSAKRFAEFFTWVIKQRFDKRLVARWTGMEEPEDVMLKAQALNIGVQAAAISPSRMARMMKWPVDVETPPFIKGPGEPIFLDQVMENRDLQQQARQAGLRLAIQGPPPPNAPGASPESPSPKESSHEPPGAEKEQKAPQQGQSAAPVSPGRGSQPAKAAPTSGPPTEPGQSPRGAPAKAPAQAPALKGAERVAVDGAREDQAELLHAEYRRWHDVAVRAVKHGRPVPRFVSEVIPLEAYALLAADLATCRTVEDVRAAFSRARAREQTPVAVGSVPAHQNQHLPASLASIERNLSLEMRHLFEQAGHAGHQHLAHQ